MDIDTRLAPAKERFSYWVDTITSIHFPIEGENFNEREEAFSGQLLAESVGSALVVRQIATPFRLSRTRKSISQMERDTLIIGFPEGLATEQLICDRYMLASRGDVVIYDVDTEHSVWSTTDNNDLCVVVPKELFRPYLGRIDRLEPRFLRGGVGISSMLHAAGHAFMNATPQSDSASRDMLQVLVHLTAVTYGLHPHEDRVITQSLGDARLMQASRFISVNIHDPRLNATMVARHLGISVRRLHAQYELTETTVAKQIQAARLERARQMLVSNHHATILEIAMNCGFYSISTFYRCFTDNFGMTPREFRSRASGA